MPDEVDTLAEPLANELARRKVLPAPQAVGIVRQLAHEIAQRHESGRLHLHIAADLISYDAASGRAVLREPLEESRSFGGADCDDEFCPPELQHPRSVLLPVQLAAARDALRASGLSSVDPRRVDLYQLGALLCRLLTGESVSAFLSRPRVAAKVPAEVRDLIERALGHDPQRAWQSAPELLRGLESLDVAVTVALPNMQPGSTRNATEPDTTPSFVGVGKADTDAGRPAPSPTDEEALPFRKLGHYEIIGRLGRGGMGDVYKGYEPQLDRHVAIKVLPAEFSRHEEMVKRFYAEASAAAKLVHPNTVEIHFIGQDEASSTEGQPAKVHFFAMRFVEGESLAELLARRGRLTVDESLAIIEQALSGLNAAHQLGMVHRDIKPGNILIDRERQRVLLADFGLVKSLQAAASMTASGVIVGTVDYMAPEQGQGEAVDARADLYAIGVVLYQILSGRLPFQADSPTGMIFKHVYETPPTLHDVASDVPRSLAEIVAKLMAKSPEARHQNVAELLDDLRVFHQGQPLSLAAASLPRTFDRPRTVIIPAPRFADEALLPATLIQVAALDRWLRAKRSLRDFFLIPAEEFVQQLQTTENQVDGAIAEFERRQATLMNAVREAETVVRDLESERESWHRAIVEADHRAAIAPDDDAARAALAEKLRSERVLTELAEQLDSQQCQLGEMRQKLSQVTAKLESLRSQRDVLNARLKVARARIRMAGGEVRSSRGQKWWWMLRWKNVTLLSLVVMAFGIAMSLIAQITKFSTIVPSGPVSIEVHPNEVANPKSFTDVYVSPPDISSQVFVGGARYGLDLAVSLSGKYVAATNGEPIVQVWDAETGLLLHRLQKNLVKVNAVAFSADGELLATGESYGANQSTLKLWNPEDGALLGVLPEPPRDVSQLIIAAQGSWLLALPTTGSAKVWNYKTRAVYWTIPDMPNAQHFAFSPDGTLVAGISRSGEIRVWDLQERKLVKSWFIDRSTTDSFGLFFTADSAGILTAHGKDSLAIWSARTGERLSQTAGGRFSGEKNVSMSADGRWLATANALWTTIVDAKSGIPRAIFPSRNRKLAFSPKGDRLFSGGAALIRTDLNFPTLRAHGPKFEITAGPLRAFSRDKPLCLLNVGSQIGVWNYEKQTPMYPLKTDSLIEVTKAVAAFSQEARRVALLDHRHQLHVWDVVTGNSLLKVSVPSDESVSPEIQFSVDSESVWIATGRGLWKVDLKQATAELQLELPTEVVSLALSPDLRFVAASVRHGQFQVWEIPSRQPLFRSDEYSHDFKVLAFTSDGQRLLGLTSERTTIVWNLERREVQERFQMSNEIQDIRFLPDRQNVVDWSDGPTQRLRVTNPNSHQVQISYPWVPYSREVLFELGLPMALSDLKRMPLLRSPLHVTFDGRYAVTNSRTSGRIAFWDLYPQQIVEWYKESR